MLALNNIERNNVLKNTSKSIMGKLLVSTGFLGILFLGWAGNPSSYDTGDSQENATFISNYHPGVFLPAEIDVLNQSIKGFKVIKFHNNDFVAIYLSTLFSHEQITDSVPEELNDARRKLLLACLYPSHEFS